MNSPNENAAHEPYAQAPNLPRPRVDKILERAAQCKLVYVIAGAGYGKTQAVRQYIEQQPGAVVRWIQLTESDNVGSRYWENLVYNVSFDNPGLAESLRGFGFPETPARFNQFASILKQSEHRSNKTFLVLDDFHLIHSEQALTFAERCAYLQIPGACVIIISRKEPEINAVSLFAKGQVSIVTEDELRFTDSEIADFLVQRNVRFSAKILPQLIEATQGWAFAILLLSLALKRSPSGLGFAVDAMKQNVFKLMEMEAFSNFPDHIKKTLVKLSLVSNLPLSILQSLFSGEGLFRDAPQIASFVWFDSFTGEGRVHPLFWEFLRSKSDLLSPEEARGAYLQAAEWCSENGFYMDAVNYFAKSRQYGRVMEILRSYPFRLPYDTCAYFLSIVDDIDQEGAEHGDPTVEMLKNRFVPILLLGTGDYAGANERTLKIIDEYEQSALPFAPNILETAYNNLAYIDIYNCTVTHRYEFVEYMRKALEYHEAVTIPLTSVTGRYAVADLRSFACLVGEGADISEFDKFLETVRQTEAYIAKTPHCMYYGYYELTACELEFYKNRPESAKQRAHRAMEMARDKKQYSIEAMAANFLLRVSMQEGNYSLAREILRQLRGHLENPVFWNSHLLHDLFTGYFYAQIGMPALAPQWLYLDEKGLTSEIHIPVMELIVCVCNYLAKKEFDQALAVLRSHSPRAPHERFALSELTFALLEAVARINTGDEAGALCDFERAYALSYGGVFEMPFIERGRQIQNLINAALKHKDCQIPAEWMRMIGRKAIIYAKKTDVIKSAYKTDEKLDETIPLSEREQSVLCDLYHGLSREEIATNQFLSVNTVKKTLQSIFFKLEASNSVDAIRIAIENKLIK
ncbi:MAG: LuxR C-terminal-related transcriptional regulator [Oscillospiraceae bacterium]|nr:LuxR C-terminal-related transcriptional regulator [Oscillospiraceae bacterium]